MPQEKPKTKNNWSYGVWVRKLIQTLALILFVVLLFISLGNRQTPAFANLFLRLDPLVTLVSMVSSRLWIPGLALSVITVIMTLLFGRVWCGWICPLGSLLEWFSFKGAQKRSIKLSHRWRSVKYVILVLVLFLAFFGSSFLINLDPIVILTRSFTVSILPSFFYLFEGVEKVLYQIPYLQSTIAWIDSLARGSILPVIQTSFFSSILISSIFFIIIALNAFAPRFWCRYLCPLGGFLGWISHLAIFRPHQGNSCNQCTRCALICRPGAIETSNEIINIQPSECTVCLDCLAGCPRRDIDFKTMQRPAPAQTFDLSRRQFLLGMATAVGGLLYLRIDLRLQQRPPRFIRPPGVDNNESFLRKCLRCSECIKICPMTALHPAGSESGLEGLWSPQVVPRVGYCDYSCNACGQICPSGAIPPLLLEEKRLAVIGKASVNHNRCLPWSSNTSCIICEEMCPTPQKSIRLEEVAVQMEDGKEIILQRPYVLREICIGCGICENRCPLEGEAAIQVYSIIV